ncbi:hypothetical protein [Verrucomicrobium sp. BvORR106]|uniref:hypothetical protein n=1 Tax=Verrucomicrobium sp. BvORR106 TaxID=1403819 RepID=UPI0005701F90|nr:hypothetical protein [Verrucomicrobium sp. BvORR106]
MPSITYWNRLEVRPRSANFASALSARIRDPLWMLTRQWQFGEFKGEDAAAPAYVQVATTQSQLTGWVQGDGSVAPIQNGDLMEPMVQAEALTPDYASRVEVGQLFEQLLTEAGVPELVPDFRRAYPLLALQPEEIAGDPDHDTLRFRQVMTGRALDGISLNRAATVAFPGLPPEPVVDPTQQGPVRDALDRLAEWVREVWGVFDTTDPGIWDPARLEYRVTLVAGAPSGESIALKARPGSNADFGWQSLEVAGESPPPSAPAPPPVEAKSLTVIPGRVQFRGMPNHRWWDFENGQVDFGGITPDKRDLARLVVMDFMLVQGNDWFLVPVEQETGTLTRVDSLVVHDVFGGTTRIERADASPGPAGQRWTLYSTTVEAAPTGLAGFFTLSPNVGPAVQQGLVLEEVRFLRDEMANMAWAVEHTAENGLGRAWPGHERDLALPPPLTSGPVDTPLRYQLQTRVPQNWLPLIPVAIDPQEGDIALELGALLTQGENPQPIRPTGRILQPSAIGSVAYRIREEEVPREGLQVSRVMCRCRGSDGSTHLWVARRKQIGRGEGSSGLRFDLAVEAE